MHLLIIFHRGTHNTNLWWDSIVGSLTLPSVRHTTTRPSLLSQWFFLICWHFIIHKICQILTILKICAIWILNLHCFGMAYICGLKKTSRLNYSYRCTACRLPNGLKNRFFCPWWPWHSNSSNEGPSISSMWIWHKSIQRFPKIFHTHKKVTVPKTEPYAVHYMQ